MAAIACHGLQSCLESTLVESRIHRLRLPSPKPLTPQPIDLVFKSCLWEPNTNPHCEESSYESSSIQNNPISSTPNQGGGWSFLQALSNVSQGPRDKETSAYVHPQVKQSPLRLSPKSLQLCTENLGNETGTDIMENGFDLLSSSWDCAGGTREQRKSGQVLGAKKAKTQNFPPPLTTIRGSESLRVRSHREGGRLVIEVTKVSSRVSCFQAERSHGRLRLLFLKNPIPSFDPEEDDENEGFEQELESEMIGHRQDDVEEDVEEEEAEETEEEVEVEKGLENEDGETDTCGNKCSIGYGTRMEKYERGSRSRCKEGDHENSNELLINWVEPLWVATS